MTDEIKLKPCPFCGGVPTMLFNKLTFDRIGVKVVCGLCFASIQRDHSDENEATTLAVMSWNRRANNEC